MYDVLIIDDERLIAEGVKAKLERAGLQEISGIHVACGGELGLRAAAELKPHIVITDIRMPDIDGVQVIRLCSRSLQIRLAGLLAEAGGIGRARGADQDGHRSHPGGCQAGRLGGTKPAGGTSGARRAIERAAERRRAAWRECGRFGRPRDNGSLPDP